MPSSTGTCRAAPAEAEVHGSPRPRTRSLTERPFCICGPGRRDAEAQRTTQQQQQVDVAQLVEHRSPKPAAGGSIPSVHANRGRSHGHRTRDLAERPAKQRGTGLTVTWPWGHLSRLRPQRWGVRANSIVDSIRQEPDPHCGSGLLSPQRPTAETSGMPALRHMRRLGNWLARLAVDQVPSRACRFESCPTHLLACGGTSRWPATAAVSKTEGPHGRASSILAPSAVGRRRRGGLAPGCYLGRGLGHEVRLLHLPPGSVGPAGVDARLSSGRSRVRVPYGARSAVVAAGCQSGLSIRAARVRSPSTAHHPRPHGLAVKDARFSAGRTPVRVRLGVPRLSWRNWQTHHLQVAAPKRRVGSTPTESTDRPTCRNR